MESSRSWLKAAGKAAVGAGVITAPAAVTVAALPQTASASYVTKTCHELYSNQVDACLSTSDGLWRARGTIQEPYVSGHLEIVRGSETGNSAAFSPWPAGGVAQTNSIGPVNSSGRYCEIWWKDGADEGSFCASF